ncbi:MAG TPA: thymidine phosphorylase [Kiritimatiellia bacterium]|jgi:pyrimidine-nucleoside phosphorylase|nr:thymidine phosphorylase [Kiritimatiellia bacterium]HOE36855.1 thymidine phosphorylase [Kiritimatiellia bacterium]HOR74213.1 thymidine phosphorylase [Kiritimatiellia bacterium]HOU58012.1 thymidine phosphorylase [Kiritimatiellia bacterium]HPK69217.1 thymidine phosphorylase [Kiritimatiellia bacterium]
MVPQWIIEKKRDGHILSAEEIRFFINGFTQGSIPDYQMAAMAMAIYLKGMTPEETAILTDSMMRSGAMVDTSSIKLPLVDKHSTGGIGDKVSLILAPLAACAGLAVPMISGRGLGITGGTLDKLESIPGFNVNLTEKQFIETIHKCGFSMIGQTGEIAPADKKLYALRDVTGTVASIPLITASIMCKKMAEGIDSLVLDVKWGTGAFMKTIEDATTLAKSMVRVGKAMNKGMVALLTDMNQPLGRTAGNALEIIESMECLQGQHAGEDLMNITLALTAEMLVLGKKAENTVAALEILRGHIVSGAAFAKFKEMAVLHGADVSTLDDLSKLPKARIIKPYLAPSAGYLAKVDAESIGRAVLVLGGGRQKTDDRIDYGVGTSGLAKIGDKVEKGQPLVTVHANSEEKLATAMGYIEQAFGLTDTPVAPPKPIVDRITG